MSQIQIYYFSGSGNSLAVARSLASELKAELIPMASTFEQEKIRLNADVIGIVFPLYDFKAPPLVIDFIRKLEPIESAYLLAVCTYGIAVAHSLTELANTIQSCGGRLAGGFAISMPHNGIASARMKTARRDRLLSRWSRRTGEICSYVNDKRKGTIESSPPIWNYLRGDLLRTIPTLFKFILHIIFKGIDSLALTADQNCNGCGICERICPVHNIHINAARPTWGDRCVSCFACLHWCPEEAISLGGIDMHIEHYHHPDIQLADMLHSR